MQVVIGFYWSHHGTINPVVVHLFSIITALSYDDLDIEYQNIPIVLVPVNRLNTCHSFFLFQVYNAN